MEDDKYLKNYTSAFIKINNEDLQHWFSDSVTFVELFFILISLISIFNLFINNESWIIKYSKCCMRLKLNLITDNDSYYIFVIQLDKTQINYFVQLLLLFCSKEKIMSEKNAD